MALERRDILRVLFAAFPLTSLLVACGRKNPPESPRQRKARIEKEKLKHE